MKKIRRNNALMETTKIKVLNFIHFKLETICFKILYLMLFEFK